MTTLPAISLDDNWRYGNIPAAPTEDFGENANGLLPSLTDWATLKFRESAAWVWRTFTLEPTDACVRYYLHISSMPPVAVITINHHPIHPPTTPPPFEFDVTDYVTLGDNEISFRVMGMEGAFGHIRLQAVGCDEL